MNEILLINERGPDFWNPSLIAEKTSYATIEDQHERTMSEGGSKKNTTTVNTHIFKNTPMLN